ncbi:hypothetical protein Fcan01_25485 [Folsomia candida]|uniref:C-type lectin domain-containing protein n=1 Tax=Folsomia candida TaxID=158441 RepID=A0A226D4B6_FOLCA|nr:hypothetical protein Fcan01_25485 [Folsomia candida]
MWRELQLIFLLGVGITCVAGNPAPNSTVQGGGSTLALTYLGAYGGKTYFRAEETTANFATSKTRCSSQGMILADIRTSQELSALNSILGSNIIFCTSARSSRNKGHLAVDPDSYYGTMDEPLNGAYSCTSEIAPFCRELSTGHLVNRSRPTDGQRRTVQLTYRSPWLIPRVSISTPVLCGTFDVLQIYKPCAKLNGEMEGLDSTET